MSVLWLAYGYRYIQKILYDTGFDGWQVYRFYAQDNIRRHRPSSRWRIEGL